MYLESLDYILPTNEKILSKTWQFLSFQLIIKLSKNWNIF